MDNVGSPIWHQQAERKSSSDMVEHWEASSIVGPVLPILVLVRAAGTPKQRGAVDEPDRKGCVRHARGDQPHRTCTHEIRDFDLHRLVGRGCDGFRIARQQELHLDAERGQLLWKRRAHIGKAAGLDERVDLGRYEEHTHHGLHKAWQFRGSIIFSTTAIGLISASSITLPSVNKPPQRGLAARQLHALTERNALVVPKSDC
jgi:hypothetical protein